MLCSRQIILEVADQANLGDIFAPEDLEVDETARIYALWKLAKAVIPHNEDGEYDSCILSAYGNALYFLARENLFLIELAIGRRVVGKFVDPEFWTMMFAPSRNANPELYERIDRAFEEEA